MDKSIFDKFNFYAKQVPTLEIGQKVFYIDKKDYRDSKIRLYNCKIVQDKELELIFAGYGLTCPFAKDNFHTYELYLSEEDVIRLTKWLPVDLPDAVYNIAVGARPDFKNGEFEDSEFPIEDSELSPCCAEISKVRNLLLQCKEDKGLIFKDAQNVEETLKDHGFYDGKELPENINLIFKQLGIKHEIVVKAN